MGLAVIGAGFGRTGTKSLKIALEQLGYGRCHHMMEVIPNAKQIGYWSRASLGEQINWDEVFDGFGAAVDWPSSAYYKELADFYPDAKVILTVRDPDAWYTSIMSTIYPLSDAIPGWVKRVRPSTQVHHAMVFRTIWDGIFDGRMDDEAHVTGVFREHIEEVKRNISPERLLIFEAKEGWEPLCAFLGKPVPEGPYPRVNETKDMKRAIRVLKLIRFAPWVVGLIIIGLIIILTN